MRRALLGAATALSGALAVAGCARQPASPAASGAKTPEASPASGATASASPASPGTAAACATTRPAAGVLTVVTTDNGKVFCVRTGTVVRVLLRGTLNDRWASIHSSAAALTPSADPRMMLQRGVTGAAFKAVRPGTADITSVRHRCQGPSPVVSGGAASPPVHCGAILAFRVTVTVS